MQMLESLLRFRRKPARRNGSLRCNRMGKEHAALFGADRSFCRWASPRQKREVIGIKIKKSLELLADDFLRRAPIETCAVRQQPLCPMSHSGDSSIRRDRHRAFGIDFQELRRLAKPDNPIRAKG